MRTTATEVCIKCCSDLGPCRIGIAIQKSLRRNQDSGEAISALPCLLIEKRLLKRMQLSIRGQALNGGDAFTDKRADLTTAGICRLSIHQDHTGPALLEAAAIAAALQPQMIAQHIEQRHVGGNIHTVISSIYVQSKLPAHATLLVLVSMEDLLLVRCQRHRPTPRRAPKREYRRPQSRCEQARRPVVSSEDQVSLALSVATPRMQLEPVCHTYPALPFL